MIEFVLFNGDSPLVFKIVRREERDSMIQRKDSHRAHDVGLKQSTGVKCDVPRIQRREHYSIIGKA